MSGPSSCPVTVTVCAVFPVVASNVSDDLSIVPSAVFELLRSIVTESLGLVFSLTVKVADKAVLAGNQRICCRRDDDPGDVDIDIGHRHVRRIQAAVKRIGCLRGARNNMVKLIAVGNMVGHARDCHDLRHVPIGLGKGER